MAKRMKTALLAFLTLLALAAGFLVFMMGAFWILDVLPLAGFIGIVIYYAIASGRQAEKNASRSRMPAPTGKVGTSHGR